MLRIAHLHARYAGQPVLQDINLQLDSHELLVVLGPSGCGKTTLLNLVAGFLPVEPGSITLDNQPVTGPGAERGVVFQHEGLLPWRNVLDNVAFGLQLAGMSRPAPPYSSGTVSPISPRSPSRAMTSAGTRFSRSHWRAASRGISASTKRRSVARIIETCSGSSKSMARVPSPRVCGFCCGCSCGFLRRPAALSAP